MNTLQTQFLKLYCALGYQLISQDKLEAAMSAPANKSTMPLLNANPKMRVVAKQLGMCATNQGIFLAQLQTGWLTPIRKVMAATTQGAIEVPSIVTGLHKDLAITPCITTMENSLLLRISRSAHTITALASGRQYGTHDYLKALVVDRYTAYNLAYLLQDLSTEGIDMHTGKGDSKAYAAAIRAAFGRLQYNGGGIL